MAARKLAVLAAALAAAPRLVGGEAAAPCAGASLAAAGASYKWPQANPSLAAPVTSRFHYASYAAPVDAEYTGSALSVQAPVDLVGGFDVANKDGKTLETYALRSIEIRKPGKVPEGAQQVVGHALEAALVHEETTGTGYWATVVVPFEEEQEASNDMLSALFGAVGTKLPTNPGDAEHVLLGGEAVPMNLSQVWQNVGFYHFWVHLPATCDGHPAAGKSFPARQFMRNETMGTTRAVMNALLGVLDGSSVGLPLQPPKAAWNLVGCPKSAASCPVLEASDANPELLNAERLQSGAVKKLRKCKSDMDAIMGELEKDNSVPGLYERAVTARDALKAAQAELSSIVETVALLQEEKDVAASAVWDSDKPVANATQLAAEGGDANYTLFRQQEQQQEQRPAALERLGDAPSDSGQPSAQALVEMKRSPAHAASFLSLARRAGAAPHDHLNLIQVGARRHLGSSGRHPEKEL